MTRSAEVVHENVAPEQPCLSERDCDGVRRPGPAAHVVQRRARRAVDHRVLYRLMADELSRAFRREALEVVQAELSCADPSLRNKPFDLPGGRISTANSQREG